MPKSEGSDRNAGFLRILVGSIALLSYRAKTEEACAAIAAQASSSIV
jgi:hypothetical protein